MLYKFLNTFLNPKELLTQAKVDINPFLLENNSNNVEKLYEFYKNDKSLLFINGFLGTGKAKIVEYSTSFLDNETIILNYDCFNSTILDDILLSFYNDFKIQAAQNKFIEPKEKTENFTQKINSYFSSVQKPFIVVINSFEAILDENRQEILDFIFHLSSFQKIKTIIIGKTFDSRLFEKTQIERIHVSALTIETLDKYFKAEKIKYSMPVLEEFYKLSRGYFFFCSLSVMLMKKDNLSLLDFLTKIKDSFLPYFDFLGKQILELLPAQDRNLFWFLTIIRHPVSIELLDKLNLNKNESIETLLSKNLIQKNNNQIYICEFLKEYSENAMQPNISSRIRQYVIDLYQTQLPLKPLERDIKISRQTMRKEIEFHNFFLPKKPKNVDNLNVDINFLSYSKVNDFSDSARPETKEQNNENKNASKTKIDLTQRKNIQINTENLPFQQNKTPQQTFEDDGQQNLKQILIKIKSAENNYNYSKIVELCNLALKMKTDKLYEKHLSTIYIKLAKASQKLANYDYAVFCYEKACQILKAKNELEKASYIEFSIARLFYETYKIEQAKNLFIKITENKNTPKQLLAKTYIQLANIEEGLANLQSAFELYKKALAVSDENMETSVLAEIYFKYALALDDKNDTQGSFEYYQKCIKLSDERQNKFLSPAYTNIAAIYLEKGNSKDAIFNYEKAFKIDEKANNYEGLYYTASRIASILEKSDKNKAQTYHEKAIDYAILTKDSYYIVSSMLAIGDFFYDNSENELALKYYFKAHSIAQETFSSDNLAKIETRINDIKFKMGVEKFEEIAEIIKMRENGK